METSVRTARITDIDRFVAICGDRLGPRGAGQLDAADLLRQLVYLPNASVVVAEDGRALLGGAVLTLHPSVRAGGYVGTIDLLAVAPDRDVDAVTAALLAELLRSAANKGCSFVEAEQPDAPAERTRWERAGFELAGPRLGRAVAVAGSGARRAR